MTDKEYIFETTEWISYDLAPSSRYCMSTIMDGYSWGLRKSEQFNSWGDVFEAWLQSLLGNVITFQKLYDKIKESSDLENPRESFYWYGRFSTLFINFEPIEEEHLDGFDDDGTDGLPKTSFMRLLQRQSSVNAHKVESPRVRGIWGSSMGFTSGFMNASLGNASPQSVVCQTNISLAINSSIEFWDRVTYASEASLTDAAVKFEDILKTVHPIFYSCYHSGEEFGEAFDYYLLTLENFSLLLYNLVHHSGEIYDTIFFLIEHHKAYDLLSDTGTEEQIDDWWFKLGIYYGTAIFLIFYTPPSVDPFDPLEEYPGLDNGAHIDYYDDLKSLVDSVKGHKDADIIDVLTEDVKDRIPNDDNDSEGEHEDGLDKDDDLSEDSDEDNADDGDDKSA